DKISYVLVKTNMRIGVYEYNDKIKSVRFTEYVPKILNLDSNMTERLSSDYNRFTEYIDKLCQNPVPEEKDVYLLKGEKDSYIKMEIVKNGSDTMGIIIDVTDDILKRRQIEKQRDIDLLTGLYNRRGLESNLSELFKHPKKLGYGALIMIDADGLKEINDKYGHENGDIYLKKLAEAICSLCSAGNGIASRQGGDEFVLFIYNYINENELLDAIDTLKYIQNNTDVMLNDERSVPLRFSFGYSLTEGQSDYPLLMKDADKRMYANKKERKKYASNHF
ncbi:MAG: GGDEF domain-containing protein, partial [Oscillospiraceae bacterium]